MPGIGVHLDALDGLRGLALLLVVCHHTAYLYPPHNYLRDGVLCRALQSVVTNGWTGVDVFFALSGFLVTGVLLRSRGALNYFSVFYARRALRIWPVYYGVLIFVFLLPWSAPVHPGWQTQLWWWLGGSNFITAFHPALLGTVSLFWSLAVEEHFYLVWPLVVRTMSSRRLTVLALALVLVEIGLRFLPPVLRLTRQYPEVIYRWTPLHCDGLLLGAAVAIALSSGALRRGALPWMRAGSAVSLIAAVAMLGAGMRFYTTPFIGLAAACFIGALALEDGQSLCSRALATPLLRRVGRYSYCMYATHTLLLVYASVHVIPHLRLRAGAVQMVADYSLVILLSVAMGAVSWALVEGPINGFRRHFVYHFAEKAASDRALVREQEPPATTLAA